jgi:hypothetical protein
MGLTSRKPVLYSAIRLPSSLMMKLIQSRNTESLSLDIPTGIGCYLFLLQNEETLFESSVPAKRTPKRKWIMKKHEDKTTANPPENEDDLQLHYDLDYRKAKPNRFADRINKDSVMVVLDPDVAAVFSTPEAVNEALRALVKVVEHLPQAKSAG